MNPENKKKDILVLYDTEAEYAGAMTEFLGRHKELPWEIRTYTAEKALLQLQEEITVLLVAESAYTEAVKNIPAGETVILNESGVVRYPERKQINKYQMAENVLKQILEVYVELSKECPVKLGGTNDTKFIGMYSPVRRCLQTTFALTMSQMLAMEKQTLYLNFEHYAGITELLPDVQTRDMADLLYFLGADQEKFELRLQTMIQHKGNLSYVPPMKSGQNLLAVTQGEWLHLLQKIAQLGQYEYVVLDLSESMQGLFEILRRCERVFTLTKDDAVARCKMTQYEQILSLYEYEDVLHKTAKMVAPQIYRLPTELEQYTKGDFANFVRAGIQEILKN